MNIFTMIRYKLLCAWYVGIGDAKASFAQYGEDKILRYIFFHRLGIKQPNYLDIGTNHPVKYSNTYYFYLRGSKGVCVEPNPLFHSKIRSLRHRDTLVKAGIGIDGKEGELTYFSFPKKYNAWNTFSAEDANLRQEEGIKYVEKMSIPVYNINTIIDRYFPGNNVDILTIDVEGWDFDIIKTLDFNICKPKTIILETLRFGESPKAHKQTEITDFLINKDYVIYADTRVNTIYCHKDIIKQIDRN